MRVLFADTFEQSGLDALSSPAFELDYRPQLQAAELAGELHGADILVVRSTRVEAKVFEAGGPLGLVVRAGAGTNTIDVKAAARRGVFVANVPGKNAVAVAELTVGLIIALDRHIPDNVLDARGGRWNKRLYSEAEGLMGKTLAIIGLGQIGLAVAERARGFGMRITVVDRDRSQATIARMKELGIETVRDLETLLGGADIVTLHLPASSSNKGLVDAGFLAMVRPGAFIINTSRGDVVDEAALLAAIDDKGLRVGIDVFADEPAGGSGEFDSKLARHPKVYTTHHIGASTAQAQEAIAAEVVALIKDYQMGIARNVVNLDSHPPVGSILAIRHYDRVGVLSAVLATLRVAGLNVQEMQNRVFAGAGAAVATIHVDGPVGASSRDQLSAHPDIIHVAVRPALP
ncbi:MAG: NAD(P)-dependent oxidoreductase [Actinomycetota bacterium]